MASTEWRPRTDAKLYADVFRREDVDYCPAETTMEGTRIWDSANIDYILALFEPVDPAQSEEYEEWRKRRAREYGKESNG